jgi:hypothetical protein
MGTLSAVARVIPNFALQHLMTAVMCRRQVLRLEAEHAGARAIRARRRSS